MADAAKTEQIKRINQMRFSWHEQVLSDADLRKYPNALALAGHIMHRFRADKNFAEVSNGGAAKALTMPPRSVARAKKLLLKRGWITVQKSYEPGKRGWSANRYSLSGGPSDLLVDEHTPTDIGDTGMNDMDDPPT